MKTLKILLCSMLLFSQLHAQSERSVFRKGYQRLGISTLGNSLDNNLSPKENVFNGNYGAGTGFVFESGHIYYFKSKKYKGKINYGLDWTMMSATYNKLNEWNAYSNNSDESYIDGASFSASLASKLGPVISFNPVEKFVIDARFQVAAAARITPFEYYENEDKPTATSFAFYNYGAEDANGDYGTQDVKNAIAFGIGTNFGITVRRKAVGLSFDYASVNTKTKYDAYEGKDNHSYGTYKVPTHSLQVKLNITF